MPLSFAKKCIVITCNVLIIYQAVYLSYNVLSEEFWGKNVHFLKITIAENWINSLQTR
jgi:hypothetical protein